MFTTSAATGSSSLLTHRPQAYQYSTLPPHAPPLIAQNTTTIHDPSAIASFSHAQRHREFNALVKKYVHQLLHGCRRPICTTPTCATCRQQLNSPAASKGPAPSPLGSRREFTPLSARIIACQLATADQPYRALCPGLETDVKGRTELGCENRGKVDVGMRDSKSFMQGLFNTTAIRSLEMNVLPPPMDVVKVLGGTAAGDAPLPKNRAAIAPDDAVKAATDEADVREDLSDEADLAFNPKNRVVSAALSRLESEARKDYSSSTPTKNAGGGGGDVNVPVTPNAASVTNSMEKDRNPPVTPYHTRPSFQVSQQSTKSRRKLSHDLSSYLTSPKNTFFTPDVNELTPPHVHRQHPRDITQRRSPDTTPSRTSKLSALDGKSINSTATSTPLSTKSTVPLPQAVTHFTLDIISVLVAMMDDTAVSARARLDAVRFLRQSCYYVFGSPDTLAACFPEDFQADKSVLVLRSVKMLFDRGMGGEIVDALWKALGELFPTVEEVLVGNEKKKAVRPSKYTAGTATKVFVITLHVIAAACPVATPEVWERCRKDRSAGTVCLDIPFEDEGLLRLVARFSRCWSAYGMFEHRARNAVREYLLNYAKLEKKARVDKLERELGRELAGDVANSGVGKGGWGLVVCALEWMRAMMLKEWDGSERPRTGGVVDASILFLRFLYEDHEALGLEESYFHNQVLADRLEYKDMPVKWYLRKQKSAAKSANLAETPSETAAAAESQQRRPEPPHLLNHAFLLPPIALVKFFRSINFYRMSAAYDNALAMYRFVNQMADVTRLDLFKPWLRNFIMKSYDISMTVYLLFEVHRTTIIKDTLDQLLGREPRECLRPLKVRFLDVGEEGVDHGGVQQEYFRLLWEEATKGEYGCFTTDERTRTSWFSILTLEPMHKFELLGLLVGLAVYNGVTLPVSFPLVVYRKLLGWKVELDDLSDGWPELVKGMRQLLQWNDGDVGDVFVRSYEFGYEAYGEVHSVDLMKVGREDRWAPVTIERAIVFSSSSTWQRGPHGASQAPPQLTIAALAGTSATSSEGDEPFSSAIPLENQLRVPDVAGSPGSSSDSSSGRILTPGILTPESASPSLSPSRRNSAVVIDENDEAAATWKAYDQQQQSLSSAHSTCSSTMPAKITSERFIKPEGEESELVTNANREQYVKDYVFWLTDKSIRPQFEAFEKGFHAVLDRSSLSLFNPMTLRHLVEGSKDIDIAALEAAAKYDDGYHPNHRCVKDFWAIVRTYDNDQRRALLEFVTASDRVPVSGISSVMFVIQRNGGDSERVPTSLTCFGRLLLPEYSGRKKMREKLRVALENGRGFGVP